MYPQTQKINWWQRPQPVWVSSLLSTLTLLTLFGLWNFAQANLPLEANATNSTMTTATTLSYQGFVTNSNGAPLTGNQNFVFHLFASNSGGTALWTETHNNVPVSEGLFNVLLGSKTNSGIPDTVWQNPVYLETVVNDQTLAPRELVQLNIASKTVNSPMVTFSASDNSTVNISSGQTATLLSQTFADIPSGNVFISVRLTGMHIDGGTSGGAKLYVNQVPVADYPFHSWETGAFERMSFSAIYEDFAGGPLLVELRGYSEQGSGTFTIGVADSRFGRYVTGIAGLD